ncbi:beta-N-acetylhexosaminidase [Zhouia spongiae]|uniref:beta-N-acetylhexosaminidase n=1 Tax=Zhouia spongiae TaxID=2202721 RepID=A0ABY3YHC5_9FLAO|nr:beta-N-acetylhexosaminidase [Zhouia spongiae]UNY97309.1 beta-N-acetylhexosaminidase [Zhouia spongiae]
MKIVFGIVLALFVINVKAQHLKVIPQPLDVVVTNSNFKLSPKIKIISAEDDFNTRYLKRILGAEHQLDLQVKEKGKKGIILKIDKTLSGELGNEGYKLDVDNDKIEITAPASTGVFYAIQTLRQLIGKDKTVAGVRITDSPRFEWRAFMLDEARYFKGKEQVKKILDEMAMLKMNVFHWHLTDDQGWRIEIKKYPKLTAVGGFRNNTQIGGWDSEKRSGEPHGGYYTQEEIKEIIAYASDRNITIVPEIEMPGHASAAIAAYPWLGTIGELKEVPVVFGKLPDSYNVANPKVYQFLEDVLLEVMNLFPGKTVHIGGDEVKFDAWKESDYVQRFMKKNSLKTPTDLQIFFTNRISNFLDKHNHRMMGWNEVLGGNVHEWQKAEDVVAKEKLAENTVIHFWKGNLDMVTDAVTGGYDIVNSYHVYTYLDYNYGYTPLEKAYEFDPVPEGLDERYHNKVLGLGCQMWSEWIPTVRNMDGMIFPRIAAYAEVGWTAKGRKDFDVFIDNLNPILKAWKEKGILYAEKYRKADFKK